MFHSIASLAGGVYFLSRSMNLQRLLLISIVANLVCLAGLFWLITGQQQSAGPSQAAPVAAPAPANCHKITRKSATALVRGFYKAGPEKPVENGMKR